MRTRKRPKSQLEEDDKPLDAILDRLVSKHSATRNVRVVTDNEGRIGLLISIKPQRRVLGDDGKMTLVFLEEELTLNMDIAPGIKHRPTVKVELSIQLHPSQMAAYRKWVDSIHLPTQPIPPCT